MAILHVKYTAIVTETIEWPDDELDDLNYDNLMVNLDPDKAMTIEAEDITDIKKDGEEFYF